VTAPVLDPVADAPDALPSDIPEGAHPIRLPVMAIEGMDTADGRYLEPGGITHRTLPIPLLAQVRTPDGGKGHDNSWIVGAVTEMTRRPGPEVISRQTGDPFPQGVFIWEGTKGWMYDDVPGPPDKSAYTLVKDRALSGNSIDMSDMTVELEYAPEDDPQDPSAQPVRVRMVTGVIGATTLVSLPAFPDAYVEIDGELMVPEGGQVLTAASVSWRSAELGDDCAPCGAGLELATVPEPVDPDAVPEEDDPQAPPAPVHRGGMLALVPSDPDALAVPDGDPAEELHLTLAYLGDDVSVLSGDQTAAVHSLAQTLARIAGPSDGGYLGARVFGHAAFNPDGGTDGTTDPCAVYLIGDAEGVSALRDSAVAGLREALGADLPTQHDPFVPHVTAGYGVDAGTLSATGPVQFDRVRVALAGDVTDYPIGEEAQPPLVAAALPVFPAAAFAVPEPDTYTPPYITEPDANGNRFYRGHVAEWSSCHTGFTDVCRRPPRSPSGYTYFHTGLTRTDTGDIPTGVVTFNLPDQRHGGHAPLQLTARQAAAHYDNTACAAADVRVTDGQHGIWVCGVVRSTLTSEQLHAFRASGPSGDWRPVRGVLEMVGVHNVNSQGFVSVRARVASGIPTALVAGGGATETLLETLTADTYRPDRATRELLSWARGAKAREDQAAGLAELAELGGMTPSEALAWLQAGAEAELLLAAEGDFNWVEEAGGLPPYIKRIKNHLQEKGMDESRAVATAKNAAQKMCDTGDTNLPGAQQVNAGSRAEACAAIADWEAKRAKSKVD
jgi:2'-5' RNA ligase